MLYSKEMLPILTGLITYAYINILTNQNTTMVQEGVDLTLMLLGTGTLTIGTAMITYGLTALRTPIDQKMKLKETEFEPDEELRYVIDKINKLANSPRYSLDQTGREAGKAVMGFTQKYEGYSIPAPKRVKRSAFSKLLLWKMGALGFPNQWLHEVIVTCDQYPEAVAHEIAHLQGHSQERLAQFVGIVSQIESNDPSLQYLGYRQWLDLLIGQMYPEWIDPKNKLTHSQVERIMVARLREMGLNEQTSQELINRADYLEKVYSDVMSYSWVINKLSKFIYRHLPQKTQGKIPAKLMAFLERPEQIIEDKYRDYLLKMIGQQSSQAAYVFRPLQLLHSYRLSQTEKGYLTI